MDYDTLTRQSAGRRVSLADPAASLVLLKPTMAIPHGGGKRFDANSLEYRVIGGWIAAGAPPPSDKDPQATGLEVYPGHGYARSPARSSSWWCARNIRTARCATSRAG